jgi:DNA mismatch repair protein MutL
VGDIRILSKNIVDQIAAGEVVERPASVVRELLDNAIDAGARHIAVEISGGGRTLMRVADDGSGIRFAELPLAFASHATSKLADVADLQQIATLGFRGEALASIGSISRTRIRSRHAEDAHGGEIDNEGGHPSAPRPAARATGTDVEVRDLFYNVPARRKFLRRDSTETGHALEAVLRQALARPEIAFRAVADGKVVYDWPAAESLETAAGLDAARRERVRRGLGSAIADDLKSFYIKTPVVTLEGLVGTAATARGDASGIYLYINGRFVRDRGALHVLREATRDFLGARQPVALVFIGIDPSLVDVNVHPAKLEVRFRDPSAVYGPLHREVFRTLSAARPASAAAPLAERMVAVCDVSAQAATETSQVDPDFVALEAQAPRGSAPRQPAADWFQSASREAAPARPARFLRAFDTFIVLETGRGLDFIDQHALHERVNFEELRARVRAGDAPRQNWFLQEGIHVTAEDAALVDEFREVWATAGFEVELYGPSSVAVRAVPLGLKRLQPAELLRDLLQLARERRAPGHDEILEEVLHRCACHASVKAGDRLTDEEIEYLLKRAAELPAEQTCPHGRPTRIRLGLRDLEKAFERK